MTVLFPPLRAVVILNWLKCNILDIVIVMKLSYHDILKYRTYRPGLLGIYVMLCTGMIHNFCRYSGQWVGLVPNYYSILFGAYLQTVQSAGG